MKKLLPTIFSMTFWLWNSSFLLIVYLGILPIAGVALVSATWEGLIPIDFLLTLVGLILIPTICTIAAAKKLANQPQQLLRLFYGVEAPIFLLCLLRLFLFRELTGASSQIIFTLFLTIGAFAYYIFYGSLATKSEPINLGKWQIPREYLAWGQLACHSLMVLMGLYAGTVLLFYALPLGWSLVVGFFSFTWLDAFWQMLVNRPMEFLNALWWVPLSLILMAFSASLLVVMPSVYGFIYAYAGWQGWRDFVGSYGKRKATFGAVSTLTAWLVIFLALQQQPQIKAFSLLEKPALTTNSRQELGRQTEIIRQGLVNSYLLPYRYLATSKGNNHIYALHKSVFNLPDNIANSIQEAYNYLMAPFLYQGDRKDIEKAEKLYGQFFDTNIQKAEANTISKAVQSTWNREEAKAGLLNINQQKVWLQNQAVTITEQGDWAEVELYEMYENQTPGLQEVFYSFSLPESAVMTGLWLGDTSDRTKRFIYQVSPRGAAQQVYNAQVQERVDPALLEQVGTRQYRLRAFPIPPKSTRNRRENGELTPAPTHMHLWLTYKVMQQTEGWALPDLGEKRNIFWNRDSKRTINNKSFSSKDWFPAFVPATKPLNPQSHQVKFTNGETIDIKPLVDKDYLLPQAQRLAVIVDTSRSMEQQQQELAKTWNWLKNEVSKNNEIHLYLTGTWGAEPRRIADIKNFDLQSINYFGSLQFPQMLQQFSQLQGDTIYDAILLLSDDGSYDLAKDEVQLTPLKAPLWMVHLAGLPPAYDDATLKAVQDSGGGVSTKAQEVLERVATSAKLGKSVVSVVDGYGWYRLPKTENIPPLATGNNPSSNNPASPNISTANDSPVSQTNNKNFAPLAARQLSLALSKESPSQDIKKLDQIHAIAKEYSIVTPYSSMIVLVNDQQREALKKAEEGSDRFNREVETGTEQLGKPSNFTEVPEPESLLFLSLGAVGLMIWYRWRSP